MEIPANSKIEDKRMIMITNRRYKQFALFFVVSVFVSPSAVTAESKKATLQTVTQQFQQATANVIGETQQYVTQINGIEQDGRIEELSFKHESLGDKVLPGGTLDQLQVISPQALNVCNDLMKSVTQYTTDLANFASGSSLKTFGANLKGLSKGLDKVGKDAGSLPDVPSNSVLKSKAFPGIIGTAVTGIGSIIALIDGRHAQKEVEAEILKQRDVMKGALTSVGVLMQEIYELEKTKSREHLLILTKDYDDGRNSGNMLLAIEVTARIEDSRAKLAALYAANPADAIAKMLAAHQAMVDYAADGKRGGDIRSLLAAVGDFFSEAQSSKNAAGSSQAKP